MSETLVKHRSVAEPGVEASEQLIGGARDRVGQAANVLEKIKDMAGHDGADREVAGCVADAQEGFDDGSVELPDAVAAEEVGMLETLQGGEITAGVINESPSEVFDPAVYDLFMTGGEGVVASLEERLRAAAVGLTDGEPASPKSHEHADEMIDATNVVISENNLEGSVDIMPHKDKLGEPAPGVFRKMDDDGTVAERLGRKFPPDIETEFGQLQRFYEVIPDHVARPIELIRDEHGTCIAMDIEEVEGETLRDLEETGRLELADVTQIEIIISQLHKAGLVHGDLNANNLIRQENGIIKIIDPIAIADGELTPAELEQLQLEDRKQIEMLREAANFGVGERQAKITTEKAQRLINDLRGIREQVGRSRSQHEGYFTAKRFDEDMVREAQSMIVDANVSPQDAAKLLGEIYDTYMAKANMYASSWGMEVVDSEHDFNESLGKWLTTISAEKLTAIRQLPAKERGKFDFIIKRAMEALPKDLDKKILRARLDGYGTLTEKFAAIKRGELVDNDLSRLDTLMDCEHGREDTKKIDICVDYLVEDIGLPIERASEMLTAMYGRCSNPTSPEKPSERLIDLDILKSEVVKAANAIEQIGLEKAAILHEMCGIVNIGELSSDQLQRMVRFAEGDETLMEELSQKEVCIVLRDATRDWNGGLNGLNQKYETTNGATLIFEVSSLQNGGEQVRNFVAMLKKAGIRPSVLVIAGHGAPGGVVMGSDSKDVIIPVEPRDTEYVSSRERFATLADTNIDQLIGDMKPDRDGNCSIIYSACCQGADLLAKDDTTLSRTAEIARSKGTGKVFQIYGTRDESSLMRDKYGDIVDAYKGQSITRAIVGKYGGIYVHDSDSAAPRLPMFRTNVIDLRKPKPGLTSTLGNAA